MLTELLGDVVHGAEKVHHGLAALIHETARTGVSRSGAVLGSLAATATRPPRMLIDSPVGQRALGIANGMFGEKADARGGALPAAMTVRLDHRRIDLDGDSLTAAFPDATGRLVVFLHGLVETERSWFHRHAPGRSRSGTDFGSRLAEDLPCTPVYVRYNTGRRVSDNGGELVDLLTELVAGWPVEVTEIVLIGHSMGGLVARSALLQATEQPIPWFSTVTRLVCLGTPHTGAPLERGVVHVTALLDKLAVAAPLVRLLALRSDGIKDLARGSLHRTEWATEPTATVAPVPTLPTEVRQYFVAATLTRSRESLLARFLGDLLVAPASAGDSTQGADLRWFGGMHHFDLLCHDAVYDAMLDWLRSDPR
ncbi:GPI inositol-deacylase [Actinophytocola gossypii]|uniref:GPI inositol-deacylase PGAP1-like alpha/beta domain-containing protein n=1 Tax=Actinophytocola gossypii TaxID=2812003 RepID=A0ABT2J7Y9_9PSEU|nr:GPI inositol-deacylase [Actinophytocola gossypii]MCT2583893.1 hypothetical protein [Actinophytocola gossypii]